MDEETRDFRLMIPGLIAWEKSGDEHAMRFGGIMTTDRLDRQAEVVFQDGLDFEPFLATGWFNDNHSQKTGDVLGYPTDVRRVKKGDSLPNGQISNVNGHWTEGYLLDVPEARKVWSRIRALESNPHRRIGMSVEGSVLERGVTVDRRKLVKRAVVRNCAITHCPINVDTGVEALAKALISGHGILPGDLGSGGALRTEALDPELYVTDYDPDVVAAYDDKNDRASVEGGLTKASAVPVMTDTEYLEGWADTLSAAVRDMVGPTTIHKAEAAVIVAKRHPNWSPSQVDAFLASVSGRAG